MELPCYSFWKTILIIIVWSFIYGIYMRPTIKNILGEDVNRILRHSLPILLILSWFDNWSGLGFMTCRVNGINNTILN